jgi:hypothetical protein
MHENKRFKKMAIFNEACFSGTFGDGLAENYDTYLMTASDQFLTSKAAHCFSDAVMSYKDGKPVSDPWEEGNCLNDLFTWNWMNILKADDTDMDFNTLFTQTKALTYTTYKPDGSVDRAGSPVMEWGDKKMGTLKVSEFLGKDPTEKSLTSSLWSRLFGIKRR